MKKRLLVARVYLDNIRYLDSKSFHRKMSMTIKETLVDQYEHMLSIDKCVLIAHILTMKFCNDYHIELLLSEYNNLNFLLSIEDNCRYKIFDVQDEGYFIHKNEGKLTHRECHNLAIKNIINSDGYNDIKEINKKGTV